MGERLVHGCIHRSVGLVEHTAVFRLHVSQESFKCHGSAFSGWKRRIEQSTTSSDNLKSALVKYYTSQLKQKLYPCLKILKQIKRISKLESRHASNFVRQMTQCFANVLCLAAMAMFIRNNAYHVHYFCLAC